MHVCNSVCFRIENGATYPLTLNGAKYFCCFLFQTVLQSHNQPISKLPLNNIALVTVATETQCLG